MDKINKNSKVALYTQLKNILKKNISDKLDNGDYIPTEKEIIKKYGVSRSTVRKAIDGLVKEGLLTKKQGQGTYVNEQKTIQTIGEIFSWTEEMRLKNKKTKTIDTIINKIVPPNKIKNILRLNINEKVIKIQRIREVEGLPVVIMVNYLPESFVPNLEKNGIRSESLYKDLEELYNIVFTKANETITAKNATSIESSFLNISEGDAVLNMRRISYIEGDIPCEVVDMVVRGDKYQYLIELSGK